MTGARIVAEFHDGGFGEAMQRVAALSKDFTPLLRSIGAGMRDVTQDRFLTATDPEGQPWKGLSPAYAQFKRGPGILRDKGMRGGLQGSMTFQVRSQTEVAVGSTVPYAAIHQFGGVIKPKTAKALVFRLGNKLVHAKSVTIPARPYLGFGEQDRLVVSDNISHFLDGLIFVA